MTEGVRIPISAQALELTRTGEPDLSMFRPEYNPAVLWRWHNDPEYHALVTAWHLESGTPIESLLEEHSDNLPYVRDGLPAQYRAMRSGQSLSMALMDTLIKDTYGPALVDQLNNATSLFTQLGLAPTKRSWWKRHKPKLPHLRVVWR